MIDFRAAVPGVVAIFMAQTIGSRQPRVGLLPITRERDLSGAINVGWIASGVVTGFLVVVILSQALLSMYVAQAAADARDRSAVTWGFIGLLFGIVGALLASLMPPEYGGSCPRCDEPYRREAHICPACHLQLAR